MFTIHKCGDNWTVFSQNYGMYLTTRGSLTQNQVLFSNREAARLAVKLFYLRNGRVERSDNGWVAVVGTRYVNDNSNLAYNPTEFRTRVKARRALCWFKTNLL